jgi:ribosomal protein L1, bacterial/chloroplast
MANHGKKYIKAHEALDKNKVYSFQEGINKSKELIYTRFDESVDVAVNLGIDASKGDQVVRGSVLLPHGTGKKVKVLVFAKGDYAAAAEKAGADYVGTDDLLEKIEAGWLDFNYAVATPDLMGMVGKVAKILGPRGLLPNKKTGTVTFDVAEAVADLKKGRLFFRNDKNGIIHFKFGKMSQATQDLYENLVTFVRSLSGLKPAASKGKFVRRITISSTMGPGIQVNADELS